MSQGRKVGGRGRTFAEIGSLVLIVAAVWMGWQVFRELAADRVPPSLAIRVSPGSPRVLARAAEAEFAAKRFDNADYLARQSLTKAPFNVRALRIIGLIDAEKGQTSRADDMLTLAGNWSLRDDPSHAWLVEHRLRQGDFGSAFAHADTLARRRTDMHPQLFNLFATAATLDSRAIPPLAGLLAANPRWRDAFIQKLFASDDGLALAANLALSLQGTKEGAFTDRELSGLYTYLMRKGRLAAMAEIRQRLQRPGIDGAPVNGEFRPPSGLAPYDWKLFTGPGAVAEILNDDVRPGDEALRVQYNGVGSAVFAEQLIQLSPGSYRLAGQRRMEMGESGARMSWTVTCVESGLPIADARPAPMPGGNTWQSFSIGMVVPQGCVAQWVRLTSRPGDQRNMTLIWFDKLSITPLS